MQQDKELQSLYKAYELEPWFDNSKYNGRLTSNGLYSAAQARWAANFWLGQNTSQFLHYFFELANCPLDKYIEKPNSNISKSEDFAFRESESSVNPITPEVVAEYSSEIKKIISKFCHPDEMFYRLANYIPPDKSSLHEQPTKRYKLFEQLCTEDIFELFDKEESPLKSRLTIAPIQVDLQASDETILSDFKGWLRFERERQNVRSRRKNATSFQLQSIVANRVIQYADLLLWFKYIGKSPTQREIGFILFNDLDLNYEDKIKKSTHPKYVELFGEDFGGGLIFSTLESQIRSDFR